MFRYKIMFEFYGEADSPEDAANKILMEMQEGYSPTAEVWEVDEEGEEISDAKLIDTDSKYYV